MESTKTTGGLRFCPECGTRSDDRRCPNDGVPTVTEEALTTGASGPPDLIGRTFGDRYEVEALIGQGGMGWVFRARQTGMHRAVALKVMRPALTETMVRRFYREARAGSMLRHPNSVALHDFGVCDDGHPYLVMEHLDGSPLSAVLRREGALHPSRAVRIAWQVCKALDEAHEVGLVHRDLKPANIFLTQIRGEADFVKVLDFGVARFTGPDVEGETLTDTGAVVGTPRYLSPEQAQGTAVDRRSDLYALGVVLFEMLTGSAPLEAPSPAGLLVKHIQEPPPPLPSEVADGSIPASLRELVTSLLAKAPDDRPETAATVIERLGAIARELPPPPAAQTEHDPATPVTETMAAGLTFSGATFSMPGEGSGPITAAREGPPKPGLAGPLVAGVLIVTAGFCGFLFAPSPLLRRVPRLTTPPAPTARPSPAPGQPDLRARADGDDSTFERRPPEPIVLPPPVVSPESAPPAGAPPGNRTARAPKKLPRTPKNSGVGPFRNVAAFCWRNNPKSGEGRSRLTMTARVTLKPSGAFYFAKLSPRWLHETNFARCVQIRAASIRFDVPLDGGPVVFPVKVER